MKKHALLALTSLLISTSAMAAKAAEFPSDAQIEAAVRAHFDAANESIAEQGVKGKTFILNAARNQGCEAGQSGSVVCNVELDAAVSGQPQKNVTKLRFVREGNTWRALKAGEPLP